MKKVFLCAILASLSYPAIASSLQDQLSAVAEAEQQGKNEEQRQHDEWVAERNREIQQEKHKAAQTDVVQSEADANRNMTEGGRDLMKSVGKAEENKSDSWFN